VRSEFGLQTISLFILDGLANITDFAFHFWMGRVLIPSDFATLQTFNSVILVYSTGSGVFQPVVSRFIAEARGRGDNDSMPAIFQLFFKTAIWLGFGLSIFTYLLSNIIAQLLNLPLWTIQLSAVLIFISTMRPIAIGALQGMERFLPFGISRFVTAIGRLIFAVVFLQHGFALHGVLIAFPLGWLAGLLIAIVFLGKLFWVRNDSAPKGLLSEGWRLSVYALVAYTLFMSLTSIDLVWINRSLSGELAGAYASLVLLRRVVALLPGVAVVIMFPRVAKLLAEGKLPDEQLIRTALIILAAGGGITLLFFIFGTQLISIIFDHAYLSAAPLLGWMGLSMIGVSLSSIWLNFYLAYKPRSFVILLGIAVIIEWLLLTQSTVSMQNAVISFGVTGWSLFIGGLLLYVTQHRNALRHA